MATTKNNNFGSNFKSAVKRGTPAHTAVWNIAQKTGKTESFIWNWLFNNGYVNRKKFGSNFVYWPNFDFNAKSNQNNKSACFQQIVGWAIASGYCTPEQVNGLKSQKDFINFFGPFFASQFGWNVSSGWTAAQVRKFNISKPGGSSSKRTASRKRTAKRHTPKRKPSASTRSNSRKSTGARKNTRSGVKASTGRKRSTTSRSSSSTRTASSRVYKFPKSGSRRVRKAA